MELGGAMDAKFGAGSCAWPINGKPLSVDFILLLGLSSLTCVTKSIDIGIKGGEFTSSIEPRERGVRYSTYDDVVIIRSCQYH